MHRRLSPSRVVILLLWFVLLSVKANNHHAAAAETGSFASDAFMGQINASVMGESALIDKETGRVIWEGGSSSTLSTSVSPYLSVGGLRHIKATLLSCVFILALLGAFASWIRLQVEDASTESWPAAVTLFLAQWTILKVPQVDTWFLVTAIVLYLLESYTCSTRRYLNNAISSPTGVEEYIESLRRHPPVVTWKVRSFHYEKRKWLAPLLYLIQRLQGIDIDSRALLTNAPSLFKKKIVSNVATGNYEYTSCHDNTIAGVWKRSQATDTQSAPFAKISLSKLLILANSKASQDYFKQQANFVTQQGQGDEFAEFSTNIQVEGFKPRMLAVRDVKGVLSAKLFRIQLFWFFTLLGLTVPYRVWFARHCDQLRVTVVKEVSRDKLSTRKSWFSRNMDNSVGEVFRQRMQRFALYQNEKDDSAMHPTDADLLLENMEAARMAKNLTSANVTSTLTEPLVQGIDDNSTAANGSITNVNIDSPSS